MKKKFICQKIISDTLFRKITGFENSSYFSKQFKRITGIAPITYIKKQRAMLK
ncbi:MAG: hypothetical protein DRI44_06700 [Chlamydiae bacterium]|nr:MAG: hypothetical protein DRI44_06700 [Chlamydiota bacterium]